MPDRRPLPAALALGVLAAVAAALAFAGTVPLVDHMTHRVQVLAEGVSWSRWWAPLWMPAPIEAWSLRPGAVLLTKLHVALFGALTPAPVAWMRLEAWLTLTVFGAGAWTWLRAHGWGRLALPAAALALLPGPALFSAWYAPELDALGAGILLFGTGLLAAPGPARVRHALGVGGVVAAVLLKESAALLAFAFLFAEVLVRLRDGDRGGALRFGVVLAATLSGFLALAASVLGSDESSLARTTLLERLPIVELNAHQFLYLVGAAGVGLVLVGAVVARAPGTARWAPFVALAALVSLPPLTFYTHYEAVYYGPRVAASLLGSALLVGLILLAMHRRGAAPTRHAAAALLASYGAVTAASLLASSAREDIASRILLACAPLLMALALAGLQQLLAATGRAPRVAAGALGAGLVAYPVAHAVDFTQDWLARQYIETEARTRLAQEPLTDSILAFNHYVQWVGPHELRAVGAADTVATRTAFVQAAAWQPTETLPIVVWGNGAFDLEEGWQLGVPLRLYWLAARADMAPATHLALTGDLSWTRRRVGLFTPLGDAVSADGDAAGAAHNLPEDMLWTTYRPGPTPLERVAEVRADIAWDLRVPFVQVPRDLLGLPRRLLAGIPVVEHYHYEARLYRFVPPAGAPVRTPDAALLDPQAAVASPWVEARPKSGPGYRPPPTHGDQQALPPARPSDKPRVPLGTDR